MNSKINGVVEKSGRLVIYKSGYQTKKIKCINFNHEEKTYFVEEEFDLDIMSKDLKDEE